MRTVYRIWIVTSLLAFVVILGLIGFNRNFKISTIKCQQNTCPEAVQTATQVWLGNHIFEWQNISLQTTNQSLSNWQISEITAQLPNTLELTITSLPTLSCIQFSSHALLKNSNNEITEQTTCPKDSNYIDAQNLNQDSAIDPILEISPYLSKSLKLPKLTQLSEYQYKISSTSAPSILFDTQYLNLLAFANLDELIEVTAQQNQVELDLRFAHPIIREIE